MSTGFETPIRKKRFADPDEIARFVAYLAQPESTYINGASLTIDGGFSA